MQVHGAILRGSREDVVIKVLKTGIEDFLIVDLNYVKEFQNCFDKAPTVPFSEIEVVLR